MNSNIQFYMNGIVGLPSNGLDLLAFLTNYPDYHHVGLVQVHPSRANKWRQMRKHVDNKGDASRKSKWNPLLLSCKLGKYFR